MRKSVIVLAVIALLAIGAFSEEAAKDAAAADASKTEAVAPKDEFTPEQRAAMKSKEKKYEFQAQVNRLMDIIINSLYKDREIFLRELVSNAADACDKIRFLSLTDKTVLGEGETAELDIKIKFDKDAKTITITDKGIGMTKDELINNLGVVAKSGTTEFLEKAASGGDALSLIGQFGVGFYSVYLVADRVTVASKSNNDPVQHIWESSADSTFTVTEDPRGNTLGRGTAITLHLKEDATEFLSESRLEGLVAKHSQFITFPISLWTSKEVDVEVPADEDESDDKEAVDLDKKDDEKKEDDDGEEASDEKKDGEEAEKKPKTKTVKETRYEWKRINTAKAIWTRNPKDITEDEYADFYKSVTKDDGGYLTKIHFAAEGEIAFKSILYIPKKAEASLYDKYYEKNTALKLYVRRVLITEEFDDFLPRYLNFVKGVVDSEDLPLNVSRETLAQNKVLKVMAKKLTRKVLEMLTRLADGKDEASEEEDEEEKKEGEDKAADKKEDKKENKKYDDFWKEFGKSIKLGVIDDRSNKAKLSKLLRYQTTKSEGKFVSLKEYVDRMAEKQKYIYYITGASLEAVENSPFLEQLKKRDLEVLFMVDPLDEYVVQTLTEFDDHTLMSVTKEGLKFPGEDEKAKKKREEKEKEEFKPLTDWLKTTYGDKVEKVALSSRLGTSPCVIVTSQYGWSANMERIMKAQTFTDAKKNDYMYAKKTLEINPRHPVIQELKKKVAADDKDKALEDMANLMYDAALLQSGFDMPSTDKFAGRIHRVMALGLGVDPSAPMAEEPAAEPEEAAEEKPAADADADKDGKDAEEDGLKDEL